MYDGIEEGACIMRMWDGLKLLLNITTARVI